MHFLDSLAHNRFPSIHWCVLLMATFSFYTYRNIFLQSEIGYKLPPVNLVAALNSFDIFAATPSTERFDLYVNLAKTFEAYKEDYLEHYNDYLLMLNSYLVLDESQIALKYYAYKYYLNEAYMEKDNFVLGSPIIEFNENFLSPVEFSTDKELNLVNKDYHLFGVKDNKNNCETFFNNYIYPLYRSQSNWKEVEIAKQMSTIINHWTLLKRLQIACFFCSISLVAVFLICVTIANVRPILLYKHALGYCLISLLALVFMSMVVLSIASFSVAIVTYKTNMNFQGLHNTSFNVIQIMLLTILGYLAFSWIARFIVDQNQQTATDRELQESESLQEYLATLMKIPAEKENVKTTQLLADTKERISSGAAYLVQNGIATVEPAVLALKNLVTSRSAAIPDIEKSVIEDKKETKLKDQARVSDNVKEKVPDLVRKDSISSEKLFSKDAFAELKALNLVSALSFNHPDVSPYTHLDTNSGSYNSLITGAQASCTGSISKDLKEKRAGFYTHADASIASLVKKEDTLSLYSGKASIHDSAQRFYMSSAMRPLLTKTPIPPQTAQLKYTVAEEYHSGTEDTSIPWDKKFGMSSSPPSTKTVRSGYHHSAKSEDRRVNTLKQQVDTPTTVIIKEKIQSKDSHTKRPTERKKSNFEYFLPSTQQSEFTESSTKMTSDDGSSCARSAEEVTRAIPSSDHSESMFSVERVVMEHRKSV
jgi:hypothetical protein